MSKPYRADAHRTAPPVREPQPSSPELPVPVAPVGTFVRPAVVRTLGPKPGDVVHLKATFLRLRPEIGRVDVRLPDGSFFSAPQDALEFEQEEHADGG